MSLCGSTHLVPVNCIELFGAGDTTAPMRKVTKRIPSTTSRIHPSFRPDMDSTMVPLDTDGILTNFERSLTKLFVLVSVSGDFFRSLSLSFCFISLSFCLSGFSLRLAAWKKGCKKSGRAKFYCENNSRL